MVKSDAYIGPKWRTERPRKTKIGTEVAHVTHVSDTTFKVKGQGHQAALLTAALTGQAAAAVSVGTYWPLRSAHAVGSAARGASAPTEGGEGWGHIVAAACLHFVSISIIIISRPRLPLELRSVGMLFRFLRLRPRSLLFFKDNQNECAVSGGADRCRLLTVTLTLNP